MRYPNHFLNLIKTMMLIASLYTQELLSEDNVKLRILAKYTLDEMEIKVADNSRIFSEEKDKTLKKGIYKIKIRNENLEVSNGKMHFHGKQILLRSENPFTISISKIKNINRIYRGELEFYIEDQKILLVLKIRFEEYISSATYSELGILLLADNFATENAKTQLIAAQEIAVRSYVSNEKKRHSDKRYAFCDLTHCMNFKGYTNKLSLHPEKILIGTSPISGYFHSTCGGDLSGPEVFWSSHTISPHYKRGLDGEEPNCKNSPQFSWETNFSNSEIETILKEEHIISLVTELQDRRVKSLEYANQSGEKKSIPIASFFSRAGRLYGWNKIKSNLFVIEKIENGYSFKGRGFGHGIGLCQWGAKHLADKGKSYQEILEFYFPETVIVE